ncbi:MAG: hypothetical protein AAF696_10830, partial [Bacteroidota bacterium]
LHYLDSLYLHLAPEALIYSQEIGSYVELRKSLSEYKIDPAWEASWKTLVSLHVQEYEREKSGAEAAIQIEYLKSEEVSEHWQKSIQALFLMDWEKISSGKLNRLKAIDIQLKQKKKKLLLKKKTKEALFLEIYPKK